MFYYAPDGKLLAESDAQGTAKKEYLYLGDQPIALWAQTAGSCINSNELRVDSGTTFSAFNSLERLEVRGGKAGTADWEVGLGNNTQTSGQFVNGHLNWVNNKVYAWTLTYNGQGAATITVTDNATTVLTKTWNQGMDVGNALKFYVKSSAGIGAGNKIAVTIDTIQGQAAFGTLQTAGDNFFSEQALHYAIPATGAGMTTLAINDPIGLQES